MSAARAVRVVIVDDHALVREGTAELLGREPDLLVVGQAATAEQAEQVLSQVVADVALVDMQLPAGSNGAALTRRLASLAPATRVLVVSAFDDYGYVAAAMDAGAHGYVLKTATSQELVNAVRGVASGSFVFGETTWRRVSPEREHGAGGGDLSRRESDVLALLTEGASNRDIARELHLGVRTVEGYVSNILAKLGVASRTEAVAHALRRHLVPTSARDPLTPGPSDPSLTSGAAAARRADRTGGRGLP